MQSDVPDSLLKEQHVGCLYIWRTPIRIHLSKNLLTVLLSHKASLVALNAIMYSTSSVDVVVHSLGFGLHKWHHAHTWKSIWMWISNCQDNLHNWSQCSQSVRLLWMRVCSVLSGVTIGNSKFNYKDLLIRFTTRPPLPSQAPTNNYH